MDKVTTGNLIPDQQLRQLRSRRHFYTRTPVVVGDLDYAFLKPSVRAHDDGCSGRIGREALRCGVQKDTWHPVNHQLGHRLGAKDERGDGPSIASAEPCDGYVLTSETLLHPVLHAGP